MRNVPFLVLGSIVLASCAPASQTTQMADAGLADAGRQCFSMNNLVVLQDDSPRTLVVRASTNEALKLDTTVDCFTDQGKPTYGFRPIGGPNQRLCIGDPVRVDLADSSFGTRTCAATVTTRLSEAQVDALPNRLRP